MRPPIVLLVLCSASCASGETSPGLVDASAVQQGVGGGASVAQGSSAGEGAIGSGLSAGPTSSGGVGGLGGDGGAGSTTGSDSGGGANVGSGGAGTTIATGAGGGAPPSEQCEVPPGELDARRWCDAPVDEWEGRPLVEKWRVPAGLPFGVQLRVPLVANLTDDNGDGRVDLCDTPDVLVHFSGPPDEVAGLLVFSGSDGALLARIEPEVPLMHGVSAIVDLDGDGEPEILAPARTGHVVALRVTGEVLWEGDGDILAVPGAFEPPYDRSGYASPSAIAVHDLEGDGSPEILVGMSVLDAQGGVRFRDLTQGAEFGPDGPLTWGGTAVRPTVADLDGDGVLEVLFGHVTYDAWGEELWRLPTSPGHAHPADFDGDGQPEVLVATEEGLTLVAFDGTVLWGPTRPPDEADPPLRFCWPQSIAIADVDGDGLPEALVNTCDHNMVLRIEATGPTVLRSEPVPITTAYGSPMTGSTAFDFGGERVDWLEQHYNGFRIFEGMGPASTMVLHRELNGGSETPVVADVDNDGSADVVLIEGHLGQWVVVYEDAERRPSPARRIWNQWNYWVGHVREDATIPDHVAMPWDSHGTYRVQARLACDPITHGG